MFYVFIDTSCHRNECLNFDNPTYKTLADGVEAGEITILSTEVIELEIKARIGDMLSEVKKQIGKFGVFQSTAPDFVANIKGLDCGSIEPIYDEYISRLRPNILSHDNISVMAAYEMYRQNKMPFNKQDKKKKRGEFPDAFTCLTLRQFRSPGSEKIHICSDDRDFREFFESQERFETYPSIQPVAKLYLEQREEIQESLESTTSSLKEVQDKVIEELNTSLEGHWDFPTDDYHSEVSGISNISSTRLDNISVTHISTTSVEVWYEFETQLTLEVGTDVVVDCPIDRDTVSLGYNYNSLEQTFHGKVRATYLVDDEELEFLDLEYRFFDNIVHVPEDFSEPDFHQDEDEDSNPSNP